MRIRTFVAGLVVVLAGSLAMASDQAVVFSAAPAVTREGDKTKINFTVSAPTDVEVAVLSADGKVVRHLAAGVLGGKNPPPEPLQGGLAQEIVWDGQDDFGKPAAGGGQPFSVRVRAGMGVKFGRFLGGEPYNFGEIEGVAADEDGNLYVLGFAGEGNQGHMVMRVFDQQGRYLREVLPFPADLAPDAMKDVAAWDAAAQCFRPNNRRNLNPDFYGQPGSSNVAHFSSTLVCATKKNGIVLTDGQRFVKVLELSGAVRGPAIDGLKFKLADPKSMPNGHLPGGPVFLAFSPDGKYMYASGFFSGSPQTPPGRVYRMELAGDGVLREFVTLKAGAGPDSAWAKAYTDPKMGKNVPVGPVHQVAFDGQGNVYIADREAGRVVAFDESGKVELGSIALKNPHRIAIDPRTGAIYVMDFDCLGYHKFQKNIYKFDSIKSPKPSATVQFIDAKNLFKPGMALTTTKDKTILWVSGVEGGLVALEDKGNALEPIKTQYAPKPDYMMDWARTATDYARDEVYVSNAMGAWRRYAGQTGEGGPLQQDGRRIGGPDLAVGYDGLLYARLGNWAGPLARFTRDLEPAPYPQTNTHVLSGYIYNRYGVGIAEHGTGVGPDGKVFISFMYKYAISCIGAFGGDGKPLNGKYLQGAFPTDQPGSKKLYPPGWDAAIIGPIPQAHGGIRVDLKGNIYLGVLYWPKDAPRPAGKEKDDGYINSVGSIVKFPPDGGVFPGPENFMRADSVQGALNVYTGLAPFSRQGWPGNTCCICRTPRFDLDPYGRLIIPNAFMNSVSVVDNAGNRIVEFGKYGNFDSQYVNPFTQADGAGKPTVAVPEIPLAWPTSAGFTEKGFYVLDTYNRRALRVDPAWKAEDTCQIK